MSAPTVIPRESLRSDEQPLSQYRSICPAAVAAAGLGIVSAVVLINPILAPVAIAAIVTAYVALRTIGASGGQLVGTSAASFGLCLATLFLAWGVSRHFSRQYALADNSRRMAEAWLSLVQEGKLKEALQLRQSAAVRITSPEALKEHYEKDAEAAKELQQFGAQPLVKGLMSLGSRDKVHFESFASMTHDGFSDHVALKYSYDQPSAPNGQQPFWIHVDRSVDTGSKRSEWKLDGATERPPQSGE